METLNLYGDYVRDVSRETVRINDSRRILNQNDGDEHTAMQQKAAHYAFEEEIPDINLFRPRMTGARHTYMRHSGSAAKNASRSILNRHC